MLKVGDLVRGYKILALVVKNHGLTSKNCSFDRVEVLVLSGRYQGKNLTYLSCVLEKAC